jgi:serine-type D-Ala-D-Ala carboxypeptidase (penicillin-binding protein 5/6)
MKCCRASWFAFSLKSLSFHVLLVIFITFPVQLSVLAQGPSNLVQNPIVQAAYSPSKPLIPRPNAGAVLLKELHSGKDLFEFHSDQKVPPASLTKIVSAMVILNSGKLQDQVVISKAVTRAPRTRLSIRRGDVFVLKDLLKAMLITSANDTCWAAARHVGGTEANFVRMMNEYVAQLQLSDTVFSNACGFDHENHYSTARDLAAITEVALQNQTFREIINTKKTTIRSMKKKRSYVLNNTNRMLQSFPGVEGVKTGYTSLAGRCLIVKATQDEKEVLLVLLNAKHRWKTAANLLHYGLDL